MKTLLILFTGMIAVAACQVRADQPKSKYWMTETRVHHNYSMFRYENSEVVCYRAGIEGGLQCKFKEQR